MNKRTVDRRLSKSPGEENQSQKLNEPKAERRRYLVSVYTRKSSCLFSDGFCRKENETSVGNVCLIETTGTEIIGDDDIGYSIARREKDERDGLGSFSPSWDSQDKLNVLSICSACQVTIDFLRETEVSLRRTPT